ncbi:MAG: ABC transporter substrate-binding protein [Gammaproteobacteria bacterium]|nr:ABC transporter substrate-binding protein [Gammaproteobacteria bacterium]
MSQLIRSAVLLLALLPALPGSALAERPQRIVSMGLCTDQLALLLAEREQIASLSLWARDPQMSYMIDAVGDLPLNNGAVEEIVRYAPDLVVTSQFTAWDTAKFLRQLGYRVEQLPQARSIEDIYRVLELFGDWSGNPERAADSIARLRARLAETRARYADRPQKTVIAYAPNGFTVGANTLEHDIFTHAGYRNLAAEMGIEGFQQLSLERLVAADPDVLQVDRDLSRPASLATAYVGHPVLDKLVSARESLDIPLRLRICAGPMIAEAIEMMAARR